MSDPYVIGECLSKVKVIRKSYTWKIQDFHNWSESVGDCLASPMFSIITAYHNLSCKISLSQRFVNRNIINEIDLYVTFEKNNKSYRTETSESVHVTIFLYDNRGEVYKKYGKWTSVGDRLSNSFYWANFSSRSEILSKESKLLLQDTLTIRCEFAVRSGVDNILRKIDTPRCSHEVEGTILSDLKQLFKSEKLSDLTVTSSCGREFHVHKNILSARSNVFAAMFENDMLEKSENIVRVTDIDGQTMYDMLHWMYTGKIESLSVSNAMKIISAADKYAIEDLKLVCENVMCETVTMHNAIEMFVVANLHNANYLKKECLNVIDKSMEQIVKTSGFQNMVSNRDPNFLEIFRELQKM